MTPKLVGALIVALGLFFGFAFFYFTGKFYEGMASWLGAVASLSIIAIGVSVMFIPTETKARRRYSAGRNEPDEFSDVN